MVGEAAVRSYVASAIVTGAVVLAPVVAGHAPALSKSPFTITNDPVQATVHETMLQKTCIGTIVPIWWAMLPHINVQFIFSSKPDATKWVTIYHNGIGPEDYPVDELGRSAQWDSRNIVLKLRNAGVWTHYAVWPDGDNGVSGRTEYPFGTIELTCKFEPIWWKK